MSRIRTIKPDFWTDEKIVDLSAFARLLFIGMWNFVDDEGRAVFSPRELKMRILPADDVDASALVDEIRRKGLIKVYEIDSKEYFEVKGFAEHQKIDKRRPSKIPPAPIGDDSRRLAPNCALEGREGKGEESLTGRAAPSEEVSRVSDPPRADELDDAGYFREGKSLLGKTSGGVLTQLKKHHDGDLREAMRSLELAKAKENPMEYVQGILRQPAKNDWRLGAQ